MINKKQTGNGRDDDYYMLRGINKYKNIKKDNKVSGLLGPHLTHQFITHFPLPTSHFSPLTSTSPIVSVLSLWNPITHNLSLGDPLGLSVRGVQHAGDHQRDSQSTLHWLWISTIRAMSLLQVDHIIQAEQLTY